jgi:hypothetical protein
MGNLDILKNIGQCDFTDTKNNNVCFEGLVISYLKIAVKRICTHVFVER